jgi:predicted amidohydrolase YtcJ
LIGPNTRIVDLAGRSLLPGFIDAHGHFPESGVQSLYQVDLSSPPVGTVRTIADMLERLREKAARTPKGEWVQGVGYDDTLVAEKRHPTRQELDQVSTEHPIFLRHVSFHLGTANSLALKKAGISAETRNPPGGVIRRQAETREPDGVLEESAVFLMQGRLRPLSLAQGLDAISVAAREYAAKGVTTAQTGFAGGPFNRFQILAAAADLQRLPIRVVVWPAFKPVRGKVPKSPMLKLGAIKLLTDGSLYRLSS